MRFSFNRTDGNPMTLLIGQTIGRYTIEAPASTGPLVSSYRAVDNNLDRQVLVQVVHPRLVQEPGFAENFVKIARAAGRVDYPGLLRLLDFGQSAPYYYLISESVDGPTLAHLLDDMRRAGQWLPLTEAVELTMKVSEALDVAHLHKLAYTVATPATIKFKPNRYQEKGNTHLPVITDLGIFHQAIVESGQASAPYADDTLAANAVRSLGLLLYELCTGRSFDGSPSIAQVDAALSEVGRLNPQLPHTIVSVLNRALSSKQADLIPSIQSFLQALHLPRQMQNSTIISLSEQYVQSSARGPILEVDPFPSISAQQTSVSASSLQTASPVDKIPSAPPKPEVVSMVTVLQIESPNGEMRTVELPERGLVIGRSQEADIVIDDMRTTRFHARIEHDGTNYLIVDTGSLNGTFVDGTRLQAQSRQILRPDQTVRIGGYKLRLTQKELHSSPSARKPEPPPPPPPKTVWIRDLNEEVAVEKIITAPAKPDLGIYLPETKQTLDPGTSIDICIILLNSGSTTENLSVAVEGLPPAWLQLQSRLALKPGEQRKLELTIAPPRVPLTKAGMYRLTVKIANQQQPDQLIVAQMLLKVTPYYDFIWEIGPSQAVIGEPIRVTIQNRGNAVGNFRLTWWASGNELDFDPLDADMEVQPGTNNSVELRVNVRNRRWLGGVRRYKVMIQVAPDIGALELRDIEIIDRRRIGL